MYYTVYKITNLLNGKYYIGVHKTANPNDAYMGSGVAIRNAIHKYGKENFHKEILLVSEEKELAYMYERRLTENFVSNDNYNMKLGGVGGWSLNASKKGGANCSIEHKSKAGKKATELGVGIHSLSSNEKKEFGRLGGLANKGKPKTPEHRAKISNALKGKKKISVV